MKIHIYFFIKTLFFFTITHGNPSLGQWKQYLYTDGISSNYTFHTHKDNKSRVWIGTQNGITLIDGLEIKKFGSQNVLP